MTSVSVFGSTGSVGESTLKVLAHQQENYQIEVLTANTNAPKLAAQARAVQAKHAVIVNEDSYNELKDLLGDTDVKVSAGDAALNEAAMIPADWTMAAIVGMAGLRPLMHSIAQGKTVAIANKEPLVAAGQLVLDEVKRHGTNLLPIDSEHNAVFQVFEPRNKEAIERIILTASGGPFRGYSRTQLKDITPEQALNHPTWDMGQKISIDSATLMNKALEVIEATQLFDVSHDKVQVMVHPQSVVHSMVEYQDGSILSQMGASDMCTPITNALGWPKRLKTPGAKLDLLTMNCLEFEGVDHAVFPAINMAYDCLKSGQSACLTMNAANEVAVEAFLNHKIAFLDIYSLIQDRLDHLGQGTISSLDDILAYDQGVRRETESAMTDL